MPLWRQMYLARSPELKLQLTSTHNLQTTVKCFISGLPDEILLQILDNATNHAVPNAFEDGGEVYAHSGEESPDIESSKSYTNVASMSATLDSTGSQYGSNVGENEDPGYSEEDDDSKASTQEVVKKESVPRYGKASNGPLRLVCKRWQRVYDEIFFREILIGTSNGSGGPDAARRILSLLTALENRPLLQTYPRSFHIDLDNLGELTCRNAVKIVTLCTGVKILSIYTDITTLSSSSSTWPLLKAIKNLTLDGLYIAWPSLHLLLNVLDLSATRNLSFDQFGPGTQPSALFAAMVENDEADSDSGEHQIAPITQREVDELFPKNKDFTWATTSLRLSDPCCYPEITEHIVRMPAHLQMLSLTQLDTCAVSEKYTSAAVQTIIDTHRDTLQSITLCHIPKESKTMLDFTRFPALKRLTMSAFDVMQIETPAGALQKLPGTSLKHLCLDVTPEDQEEPFTTEQQMEWVSWLTEFASVKQSKYPDSKLEEVFIQFKWMVKPAWLEPANFRPWPWAYLERGRNALAKYGLSLGYDEPLLSKEMWDMLASRVVEPDDDGEHFDASSISPTRVEASMHATESAALRGWLNGQRSDTPPRGNSGMDDIAEPDEEMEMEMADD